MVNASIFSRVLCNVHKWPSCGPGRIAPLPGPMYGRHQEVPCIPMVASSLKAGAGTSCIYSTLIAAGDKWYTLLLLLRNSDLVKQLENGIFFFSSLQVVKFIFSMKSLICFYSNLMTHLLALFRWKRETLLLGVLWNCSVKLFSKSFNF